MKKKAEGMSLRETFAIHRRAARDMRRIAPGCFAPFILCAVVEAAFALCGHLALRPAYR